MTSQILIGILIPFVGTTLGSACVFFMINRMRASLRGSLCAVSAGVMAAASVWSLLIPSIERSEALGKLSFLPAAIGFLLGVAFLIIVDRTAHNIDRLSHLREGSCGMLLLAVTIHNIPEGMAVGAVFSACLAGGDTEVYLGALVMSVGIAIQNFPEGAIISMPLKADGMSRRRAFLYGTLSGAVEPVAALATILLADVLVPFIPYLLGFAAGAMMYAVAEELIPEMNEDGTKRGVVFFSLGFLLMMTLDVTLG